MTVCPKCGGYGYYEKEEDGIIELIKCECQHTNEEWLRNCSTEELAELIRKLVWCSTEIWQRFCTESDEEETDIKIVLEWLKEKHK